MNVKSSNKCPSEIELVCQRILEKARFAGVFPDNEPIADQHRATAVRMLEDNLQFKEMTMKDRTVPDRLPQHVIKGYVPMEVDVTETHDLREELIDLLVVCAVLPDSKVLGNDMWCRPTDRLGLKAQFDEKVLELQLQTGQEFKSVMEDIKEQYLERIQIVLDKEDDLYKNAEVDDLAVRFQKIEDEFLDEEYNAHVAMMSSYWNTADQAMKRHERMAMRLALQAYFNKTTPKGEPVPQVTDDMVQVYIDGEEKLPISMREVYKQDCMILQKNNASYFRRKLEDKAVLLRELSFKAEQMKSGRVPADWSFVSMVTKVANKTKQWAEGRFQNSKPYSKRAVYALYNEAVHTLVALGVFKTAYTKKEFNSDVECSFFWKSTAEDMVHVRTGADWADELRSVYYESDDGTGRTPVRGSGND